MKKSIQPIIFISSAVILAIICSIVMKNFTKTYQTDASVQIESQKDGLLIGGKQFGEITEAIEIMEHNKTNVTTDKTNDYFFESEEDADKFLHPGDYAPEKPSQNNNQTTSTSQTKPTTKPNNNTTQNNNKNEESITTSQTSQSHSKVEVTEEAIVKAEELAKISETDLYFLQDIVNLTDDVMSDYNDVLSYALTGDFSTGIASINNLKKDLEQIKSLKVENESLVKVKNNVISGTECFINGFTEYFNYEQDANTTLKSADDYFYKAQDLLDAYLETLK